MKTNRRNFLKTSATTALGLSGLTVISPSVLGKPMGYVAPSDKVNLACVGIGNRGNQIIKALAATGLCNIVALCDVDMGAPQTLEVINMFPKAKHFQDFRVMFDKMGNEFEAISVATPDFSHFPVTMMGLKSGKHVYVEKPMARTFREVELMIQAAKKYPKLATQMGNQGHSEANYFQFKAWKEAGIIKDIYAVTAHMNNPRRWHGWDPNITSYPAAESIPSTLDWDVWTAQAEPHAYNKDYHNGQWRCWYDFGMGALGDWGAHTMDTVHEFLDLGLPYEVNPTLLKGHNPFFYPMSTTLEFKFPERGDMPALTLSWYDGVDNIPPVPAGYGVSEVDPNIPATNQGQVQPAKLNPGKIIYGKDLTFKGGSHGSTLSIIPEEKAKEMESMLPEVPESPSNHFANFLKACKGEEKTRSPFEIAGPLSQVFCLGVMAQWTGLKLEFDRETKQITNNPLANQVLAGMPPRKGWEEYYTL
ncbi:Gfo/Idh/MocA family oxidoreductase [Algoriphagus zhangzhouensis]|uniref:Tat (Twin-arginine translocation) pathway signal sequence n=1 Tax=Algoriphagus zhangzhouensis TaxID=1073327 RepID=A0A1M7ZEL2_9BACT|nr:Gfo/Idh/MocA family oxidoreductase [Algoriphagus zhangzhouensis]TDY46086.1 secreted protein [Algoriphagus zhangzhouensis]SHO63345.1 Tat (twin-arginine translocation) pathway signal sequence [Algoriphagus zhangzhouensis]